MEGVHYIEWRYLELKLGHRGDVIKSLNFTNEEAEVNKTSTVLKALQLGSVVYPV